MRLAIGEFHEPLPQLVHRGVGQGHVDHPPQLAVVVVRHVRADDLAKT